MPLPIRSLNLALALGLLGLLSACTSPASSDSDPVSDDLPTAVASYSGTPTVSEWITLDGSASTKAAWFEWSSVSYPAGSEVEIYSLYSEKATFCPDVAGTYEFQLEVTNNSGVATTTLKIEVAPQASSTAPVVSIKYTGTPVVGSTLTLDGSATTGAA